MYNGYNKGVEPPSVPLSYTLYTRYANTKWNTLGMKGVHWRYARGTVLYLYLHPLCTSRYGVQ